MLSNTDRSKEAGNLNKDSLIPPEMSPRNPACSRIGTLPSM